MKLLIFFILVLEFLIIYKIMNNNENFQNIDIKKTNNWKNKDKEIEMQYQERKKMQETNNQEIISSIPENHKHKYYVTGFVKLKGDGEQLSEADKNNIKMDLCNKLNKVNKSCKIKIKGSIIVEYIISISEVDILKIKEVLKVGNEINNFKITETSPPNITNKAYRVRKETTKTINPKFKNKNRDYPPFYDWNVQLSKPFVCSPPQKYDNSPLVEYELSNGTPLSFLDETKVGYILPKFLYKEY